MRSKIFSLSLGAAMSLFLVPAPSAGQTGAAVVRVRETLDRGVYAQHLGNNTAYISWRLLETDGVNTKFNLYRTIGSGSAVKRNSSPIATTTDFLDTGATNGVDIFYEVRPVVNGREGKGSSAVKVNSTSAKNYISINVGGPVGKVGIGDLDGDGKYDFVVRTSAGSTDPHKDLWHASTGTYTLKAYKSDGTLLWTYDMGWNIETGVWYSPYVVYDFDGDGKAEVALKTGLRPGTKPDARVKSGPEYLTILATVNGGVEEKAQANWPNRDYFKDGETEHPNYNHYSRNQIGVAYLDGKTPCIIAARGTYGVMKARAFVFTGAALVQKWDWMSPLAANGDPTFPYGAGSHSMHAADVDDDGKDEVVLGALTLDDGDGVPVTPLWWTFSKHPDHVYVGDIDPNRPGLEAYHGYEDGCSTRGWSLWNAKTNELLKGAGKPTWHLHGSGLVSDLDPGKDGMELWSAEEDQARYPVQFYHSATGDVLDDKGLFFTDHHSYEAVYWDADLQREAIVLNTIYDLPSEPVSVFYKELFSATWASAWKLIPSAGSGTAGTGAANGVGRISPGKIVQHFTCTKTDGLPVSSGQKYRVTASMRSPANAGSFRIKIQGVPGTSGGSVIDDLLTSPLTITGSSDFRQMSAAFTIPANVASIKPQFFGDTIATSTEDQLFEIDHLFIIRDDNEGRGLTTFDGADIAWADIYGDWREEIIASYGSELRIYSTTTPANDRRVTLMQDPIYRADVAHVAMGYEQVPTTSYTLAQPVGQDTMAISPNEDVLARGGSYAGQNFSTGPDSVYLGTKNASTDDMDRKSFLQFDLAHVPAGKGISKATLRLWVTHSHNPVNTVHFVSKDNWLESTLKWTDPTDPAPPYDPIPLDSKTLPNAGRWYELDVTAKAQSELAGDGCLSLALISNSSGNAMFSSSRGSNPPHLLIETSVDAHATIAHWRFEPGAFLTESGGFAPGLTTAGTSPLATTRPTSGSGSKFSSPIPQTGQLNNQLANFGIAQLGNFYASDSTGWMNSISETNAFTLEAYVNRQASYSSNMFIVSQWTAVTNSRSFVLGVDASGKLILLLSPDGISGITYASNITLALNKDYYVAVSFDGANQQSGIQFHVKNLTDGGVLQTVPLGHAIPGVINSPAPVIIGTYGNNDGDRRWKGLIDEVRISDAALPVGSLLISAP